MLAWPTVEVVGSMMGLLGFANDCSTWGAPTGSLLAPNNQEKKREKAKTANQWDETGPRKAKAYLPLAPGSSRVCHPSFLLSAPFSVAAGKSDEAAPTRKAYLPLAPGLLPLSGKPGAFPLLLLFIPASLPVEGKNK